MTTPEPATDRNESPEDDLTAQHSTLTSRIEELTRSQESLRQHLHGLQHELAAIHSSKMWRLWMASIAIRRLATYPLRLIRNIPNATRSTPRLAARAIGWMAIVAISGARELRARLRRRSRSRALVSAQWPNQTSLADERRLRILIVTPYPVFPANHGGGVRLFNLLQRLGRRCDVYLVVFSLTGEDELQRQALEPYCTRIDFHPWVPIRTTDLLGTDPPNAGLFWSPRVAERIRDLVFAYDIDVVQLEHTELGQYLRHVPSGTPTILSEIDVLFQTLRRRMDLRFDRRFPDSKHYCSSGADVRRTFVYETGCCRRAQRVITMSETDAQLLESYLPDGRHRIRVVPNGVDVHTFTPPQELPPRLDILFVGNFQNLPNVDALDYLVQDIWPLLRLRCPEARLSVVGAHADSRVGHYDGRFGITVVGEVDDVAGYYHSHRVLVAPIRAGSGTRLKILEAFAAQIPVVATSIGAEGIAYDDGVHLLIADTAARFARAIERLLVDDDLCSRLTGAARELVLGRYDWERIADGLVTTYHELLSEADRSRSERVVGGTPSPVNGSPDPARPEVDISVIIPTRNGGDKLLRTLDAVNQQEIDAAVEVICVDSGSTNAELRAMIGHGPLVWRIDGRDFNHGLTRDLGARLSRGRILVFLNQDAVPAHARWLASLVGGFDPANPKMAAVQGGISEFESLEDRFFWDSCGERFYFTSESKNWIRNHGIGFSTVNCAIRREVWERHPFGWAYTMEDKKWQRRAVENGFALGYAPEAMVRHTHDYDLRSLLARCVSEGYGWRCVDERYSAANMLRDLWQPAMYRELIHGRPERSATTAAEVLFPVLRPLSVYWGNHFHRP